MNMMTPITSVSYERPSEADGLWDAVEAIETQLAALKRPHGPIRSICDEIASNAQQLRDWLDLPPDERDDATAIAIAHGLDRLIRHRRV